LKKLYSGGGDAAFKLTFSFLRV